MADSEQTLDKVEIIQTLNAYMQAIDASDTDALRKRVFTPEAEITLLEPLGIDGYCGFVDAIMREIRTQHLLMGPVVDVAGDEARSQAYFVGFHRVPAGPNSAACDAIFGKTAEATDVIIGGVYNDHVVRTPNGWRIRERKIKLLWDNRAAAGNTLAAGWMGPA
jgi:hypothetical protein